MRLYRTIKHLKPKQLFYFVKRRFFAFSTVDTVHENIVINALLLHSPLHYDLSNQPYTFTFLNKSETFAGGDIDWVSVDKNRLWVYNLHYFDYLRGDRDFDEKLQLIKHWIEHNPQNQTPGWEPFTCSLRIVNWIFFIVQHQIKDPEILSSLYTQVLWLEKNDEKHILANHYFENLKALLFASYFFKGADPDRWFDYASKKLEEQVDEQFLLDGGHYERTPQYHGLMLENLLDIYNLIEKNTSSRFYPEQKKLSTILVKALSFYQGILMPDGSLPMFNDTAQGISPSFEELSTYTKQLNIPVDAKSVGNVIDYPQSGLFGYKNQQDMWIIDAGDIGPSYQPGHTHCDMLSYELFLSGFPIIVDTGVFEYQPGELRRYVRSTKAHNTVQLGSHEQSEVWGEFRVGERAKIVSATIEKQNDIVSFAGEINAFRLLSKSIHHKRLAKLELDGKQNFKSLYIEDSIWGDQAILDGITAYSYLHFHPEVVVSLLSESEVSISRGDLALSLIVNSQEVTLALEKCAYCPEFGVLQDSICLVLSKNATMFDKINYMIKRV